MVKEEIVEVEIPPGVDDGSKVAVPGMGNEGRGGGHTGDLYVLIQTVTAEPHPFFTRKGDNLFCTVPITFSEAALGCRIEVSTVEGPVKVRVPAGVQSGQKLRLSGRGAPSLRGSGARRSVRDDPGRYAGGVRRTNPGIATRARATTSGKPAS